MDRFDASEDLWNGVLKPEQPTATTHVVNEEKLSREAVEASAGRIAQEPIVVNLEHVRGMNPTADVHRLMGAVR